MIPTKGERIGGGPATMLRWDDFKPTLRADRSSAPMLGNIPVRIGPDMDDMIEQIRVLALENTLLSSGRYGQSKEREEWTIGGYSRTDLTKKIRHIPANGAISPYARIEQGRLYGRSPSVPRDRSNTVRAQAESRIADNEAQIVELLQRLRGVAR